MRPVIGIAVAACLIAACSSSTFALTNASVDSTYTCPIGANNAPYSVQATVDAHNGTSGTVRINSVTADMALEALNGPWLEKIGTNTKPAT
jgi:hypothetical protein